MARVTGFLENFSGRIGNVIIVHRGNKTYVKSRPAKREKITDPYQIAHNAKFGLTGKIASRINSIEELKYFWKERYKKQSSFHKIFNHIFQYFGPNETPEKVYLLPELFYGFSPGEALIKIDKTGLLIESNPLSTEQGYLNNAEYIIAAGVILLENPTGSVDPKHEVIAFKSEKSPIEISAPIAITVPIDGAELDIFMNYSLKRVFAVLITLDAEEKPIQNSLEFSEP
jgi:hypothetical protein